MLNTTIKLLKNIDIGSDYSNTFTFANVTEQENFFTTKSVEVLTEYTYQRKDNFIRYDGNVATIRNINYLMYRNPDFENKWFYCFVDRVEFVSESVARIYFTTDVVQTWLFDFKFKQSYIEREHVSNDSIGNHVLDEGLSVGEYVRNEYEDVNELEDIAYVIGSTKNWINGQDEQGQKVTGNYSGIAYFSSTTPEDVLFVNAFIAGLTSVQEGAIDALKYIFTMPLSMLTIDPITDKVDQEVSNVITFEAGKNYGGLDGYVPKNNKLYCFPYNFMELTDHRGRKNVYRYELFGDFYGNPTFTAQCDVSPSPTVTIYPLDYRNSGFYQYFDEPMILDGYPLCSWTTDFFANWFAQNSVSLAFGAIGSLSNAFAGVATGNPLSAGGLGNGILGTVGSVYQQSIKPNPLNGTPSGAGTLATGKQTVGIFYKTITYEFAQMIDNYFDRYGYKTNRLKVPRLKTRKYWDYLKLYESNIVGDIIHEDLEKLKSIFKEGITLWHTDDVGNYSKFNEIEVGL